MAVNDIVSDLKGTLALSATVATDTTTQGAIIDTADFELGFACYLASTDYTDGSYQIQFQESDDEGMAGASVVAGEQLIGTGLLEADTGLGGVCAKLGCFSTKRYVQVEVVSTGTATGATLVALVIEKAEDMPTV